MTELFRTQKRLQVSGNGFSSQLLQKDFRCYLKKQAQTLILTKCSNNSTIRLDKDQRNQKTSTKEHNIVKSHRINDHKKVALVTILNSVKNNRHESNDKIPRNIR